MSFQQLADYCQQHVNIKQDSQKFEEVCIVNVRRNWKSPSSTNKNHEEKTLLAHAMGTDNSTGTMTARTSSKFVEIITERDIKCRIAEN